MSLLVVSHFLHVRVRLCYCTGRERAGS
jgi:hypothetical protein